jgi:hypothetical protein
MNQTGLFRSVSVAGTLVLLEHRGWHTAAAGEFDAVGARHGLTWRQAASSGKGMNELLVGYARVSTEQQDLTAQRDGLHALGVGDDRIYVDHGLTGTNRDRPGLRLALAACRAGDTLVVTKLDRLARSLPDAVTTTSPTDCRRRDTDCDRTRSRAARGIRLPTPRDNP